MEKHWKIIYADDEPINIKNFTLNFENEFEIFTAASGGEALSLFRRHAGNGLAAVVSDQRMPGMSGVEFLAKAYQLDPEPMRIILTGYSDFNEIQKAVNEAHIFQYVLKPWDPLSFRLLLLQAVDVFCLHRKNQELLTALQNKNQELETLTLELSEELDRRKREEAQRRQAEIRMLAQSKLASLGQMATGIAHEINQPLSYIRIILEAARRDFPKGALDPEEFTIELKESLDQVGRIGKIINHLRIFGRAESSDFEMIMLPQVLENSLIPLRHRLKMSNIEFAVESEAGLPAIHGISNRLEQVFINLIANAIDAMQDNDDRKLTVYFEQGDGNVIATVRDNGCGMEKGVAERIFEPFFTTKEVGKGTGVGLSIVYGIITEHNGTISCQSTPGKGTAFVITFPLSEG